MSAAPKAEYNLRLTSALYRQIKTLAGLLGMSMNAVLILAICEGLPKLKLPKKEKP